MEAFDRPQLGLDSLQDVVNGRVQRSAHIALLPYWMMDHICYTDLPRNE